MGATSIEWTEATWNPVTGCTRVSKGCDFCYAVSLTRRLAAMGSEKYDGLVNEGKNHFNGIVKTHEDALDIPLRTSRETTFFVNSMSDLFHPRVPEDFIVRVFEVMAQSPQHTFQVLTKRPERMKEVMKWVWQRLRSDSNAVDLFTDLPLSNVWLGTSVEDAEVTERIIHLAETEASVRFLSCEPLLGPLPTLALDGIHWVIVGGESGAGARPFDVTWAEDIIQQCKEASVACFVKQVGSKPYRTPKRKGARAARLATSNGKGGDPKEWPPSIRVREYPDDRMIA